MINRLINDVLARERHAITSGALEQKQGERFARLVGKLEDSNCEIIIIEQPVISAAAAGWKNISFSIF